MRAKILIGLLKMVLPTLLDLITPDLVKSAVDRGLAVIERAARESKTRVDDGLALPLCGAFRAAVNVDDQELINRLAPSLVKTGAPSLIKEALDAALDAIESIVVRTDNEIDDKIVLPLCSLVRVALDIPDNDEKEEAADD